jgi:hypothetical protein
MEQDFRIFRDEEIYFFTQATKLNFEFRILNFEACKTLDYFFSF